LKNPQFSIFDRTWIALLALAMAAQLLFVTESHRQLPLRIPIVDAASYHRQAVAVAAGQKPESRPFWQPPLYVYWLAFVYRFVSTNIIVVRLLQSLFGVATVLLTFLTARQCCRVRTAFFAAVAVTLYGPLLFFTSQLLPTGMATAANMAVLYCWLRLSGRPSWLLGLLTGMLMGLAALIVSNVLVLAPLMLIWVACKAFDERRVAAWTATGGALLAGLVLVVAPVTIRNCVVSGQFVPISVNAGINLYIGNNPNAARTVAVRPGIDWDRLVAMPYRAGAETDSQAQSFFFRKGARFARDEPTAFINGLAGKALQFFNSREIPRNVDLYAFRPFCGTLRALVWQAGGFCFPFGIVAPFALWGMVAATRRDRGRRILLTYTLAYSASVILFFPSSRYAAPVMPAMIIFCVLGVESLLGDGQVCPPKPWRRRDARPAERIAGCAVCLILLVLLNLPLQLPTDTIDYRAELHTNVGVGLQTRGRIEEAVEHYRQALRLIPSMPMRIGSSVRPTAQCIRQIWPGEALSAHWRSVPITIRPCRTWPFSCSTKARPKSPCACSVRPSSSTRTTGTP